MTVACTLNHRMVQARVQRAECLRRRAARVETEVGCAFAVGGVTRRSFCPSFRCLVLRSPEHVLRLTSVWIGVHFFLAGPLHTVPRLRRSPERAGRACDLRSACDLRWRCTTAAASRSCELRNHVAVIYSLSLCTLEPTFSALGVRGGSSPFTRAKLAPRSPERCSDAPRCSPTSPLPGAVLRPVHRVHDLRRSSAETITSESCTSVPHILLHIYYIFTVDETLTTRARPKAKQKTKTKTDWRSPERSAPGTASHVPLVQPLVFIACAFRKVPRRARPRLGRRYAGCSLCS